MRLIALSLSILLLNAGGAMAADYRVIYFDSGAAQIVDYSAIGLVGPYRRVTSYYVAARPFSVYNKPTKTAMYSSVISLINCNNKQVNMQSEMVYNAAFEVVDRVNGSGGWQSPPNAERSRLEFEAFCSKNPSVSPIGRKLPVGDLRSALLAAHELVINQRQ